MSSGRAATARVPRRAPELRLVETSGPAQQRRPRRRLRPAVGSVVTIVALVALAVGFAAQQVDGQARLDAVREGTREASQRQQHLRAEVAEAESPERILGAAREVGMVEPGPVVAVPAPPVVLEADPG